VIPSRRHNAYIYHAGVNRIVSRATTLTALALCSLLLGGCMGGGAKAGPKDALDAFFVYAPLAPEVGEQVTFLDSSNGSAIAWDWDFGDGEVGQGQEVQHTYRTAGVYEVRFEVRDGQGKNDEASRILQVGGETSTGGLGVDIRYKVSGQTVEFEPIVSPRGSVVEQYFWDFGDGSTSKQSAPEHTYDELGEYLVELRIATGAGVAKASRLVAVGVASSEDSPLASRPFTIIAIVDSGINPYHDEFAAPEFQSPPSTFIDGYPADALELPLSLAARSYSDAVRLDQETWSGVKKSKLYWIPGTRIIGAISVEPRGETKILDDGLDEGHGTATASDAAGRTLGACPDCLIVAVEGLGDAPLNWALSQPWIDIVSNSWTATLCLPSPLCVADANLAPPIVVDPSKTKAAVEGGKTVLFAAGNGHLNFFESPQITYWSAYNGPDWIVTVGAADSPSGATVLGTGRPVDVVSYGLNWKAAAHNSKESMRGFSGTSAATPIIAGAFGYVLQQVRVQFNDTQEGPHSKGLLAVGEPGKGMLSDGKFTRAELERAMYTTAKAATGTAVGSPPTVLVPHSAAAFAYAGYGIIDAKTAKDALLVVQGEKAMPSRSNEDAWATVDSEIRQSIWGGYDAGLSEPRETPSNLDLRRSEWAQFVLG
jgi:PKD repeat protein